MRVSSGLPAVRARVAAALAIALAAAPARPVPAGVRGTYRLQGRAMIEASPFPARDEEIHADAVLSPGAGAGQVRIRLAGQGFACELLATVDAAGGLALAAGQRCTADLRSEETEGRVEARLLSGVGRVSEEALSLDLAFALSGSVRVRSGGGLDALGQALSLPGADGEPVPIHGRARGRAEGRRDRSRAAD
jgi:hypothetical protein